MVISELKNPFDFFDQIFCINLDTRPDRWKESEQEFLKLGILDKVKRVSGVVAEPTWRACDLSHISIIDEAIENKYQNILILEDDVCFSDNALDVLSNALTDLQKQTNWDLFYLGETIVSPFQIITPNLLKLGSAFATHAYAINGHFLETMLERPPFERQDVWFAQVLQPQSQVYGANPLIAFQRPSWSDVENRMEDHKAMMLAQYEKYKPL